ncbi:MAG: Mov34/MPN/PAD-1 family protein [Candidatus Methanoplasma sp.]|jgi:proteasome lid subunit RPN8/RPN11|nr:Mov34/MPN/PAD-1 family protein [Candidatus Methanoplasma sp.]
MPKVLSSEVKETEFRPRSVKGSGLFVSEGALNSMIEHADRGAEVRKEIMGFMMGTVFKDDEGEYAVVTDIATGDLEADEVSVRFDTGSMESLFESIDARGGNDIVGWYHSHPGFGCYLSEIDIKTHEGIFGNDTGFALVIDPDQKIIMVFDCHDHVPGNVAMILMESE